MANRLSPILKVPINFGNPADLSDALLTTLGIATIYIPENSVGNPVSFVSVMLNVAFQDTSTTGGATLTEVRAACTLSGASASTVTETNDLTNSGENSGGVWQPIDFTSYFNTNYGTVTSKTCQVDAYFDVSTGTGADTRGVYAWLEIQYTFDDSAADRIKTIGYDLESLTGSLPTAANTTFGTLLQLTGVGGILNGYTTPVIRHYWAEIRGNCGNNNIVTDHNINYSFDGAGSNALPTRESALGSDTWQMYLIDLSSLSTNTTHTIDLWNSLATRWECLSVTIYVTYEYVVSGTTRILNYLELPLEFESPIDGTSAAERHRQIRSLIIAEPGTITQHSISLNLQWNSAGGSTIQLRAGSQASFRGYATTASVVAGQFELTHLLDSRSASGSAVTLARGKNDITVDLYRSTGTAFNVSGVIRALYESDVPSSGIDTAAKCCYKFIRQMLFGSTADNKVSDVLFDIPETDYWLIGMGIMMSYWLTSASTTVNVWAEVNSGEGEDDGWRSLYTDPYVADNELSFGRIYVRGRNEFKRHPDDVDSNRLDLEIARRFRIASSPTTFRFGWKFIVNYHAQIFTISGDITGSNGGMVNLYLFNADTNELYSETTRSGDGAYSFNVHNPVQEYYVVAIEDDTYKGTSKRDTANTDFDISLSPPAIKGRITILTI